MILLQQIRTGFKYLSIFPKRDIYLKEPFRLGILSPPNVTGPKIMVTHEHNKIPIDLNDMKEDKQQDHAWIEEIDFNESRLSPKQKDITALFKQFPIYLINHIQVLD